MDVINSDLDVKNNKKVDIRCGIIINDIKICNNSKHQINETAYEVNYTKPDNGNWKF